jgi:hypothetical protein
MKVMFQVLSCTIILFVRFWWDWGLNFFFALAKQKRYVSSHTSSPLCSGYFADGLFLNYFPRLASNYNPPDLSLPS